MNTMIILGLIVGYGGWFDYWSSKSYLSILNGFYILNFIRATWVPPNWQGFAYSHEAETYTNLYNTYIIWMPKSIKVINF